MSAVESEAEMSAVENEASRSGQQEETPLQVHPAVVVNRTGVDCSCTKSFPSLPVSWSRERLKEAMDLDLETLVLEEQNMHLRSFVSTTLSVDATSPFSTRGTDCVGAVDSRSRAPMPVKKIRHSVTCAAAGGMSLKHAIY